MEDKCVNTFDNFIHNSNEKIVVSPYTENTNNKCTLLTTKKMKYYTFTYDPTNVINNIKKTFNELNKKNMDLNTNINIDNQNDDIFDQNITNNCCNVISISLYALNSNIAKYIFSIAKTINNVKREMPDWLVRVYLDDSVFCQIKSFKNTDDELEKIIYEKFQFIYNSDNVEIYIYNCPNVTKDELYMNRTFRFFPFLEKDVNICICRDADGIVSRMDCHNIKVFAKSDKLFFLPLIAFKRQILVSPYSKWIKSYSLYFAKKNYKYTDYHCANYDLLAGGFGINLRINYEYYKYSFLQVNEYMETHDNFKITFDECLLFQMFNKYIGLYVNKNRFFDIIVNEEDKDMGMLIEIIDNNLLFADANINYIELNSDQYYNLINFPCDLLLSSSEHLNEITKFTNKISKNIYYGNFYNNKDIANSFFIIDLLLNINNLNKNVAYDFVYKYPKLGSSIYLSDLINIPYYAPLYDQIENKVQDMIHEENNMYKQKIKKYEKKTALLNQ